MLLDCSYLISSSDFFGQTVIIFYVELTQLESGKMIYAYCTALLGDFLTLVRRSFSPKTFWKQFFPL